MLVIGRKLGERIIVDGGRIVITLVRMRGDSIRLGFEASKDIKIMREELEDRDPRLGDGDDGHGRPTG